MLWLMFEDHAAHLARLPLLLYCLLAMVSCVRLCHHGRRFTPLLPIGQPASWRQPMQGRGEAAAGPVVLGKQHLLQAVRHP
jgi:hypothetical protein